MGRATGVPGVQNFGDDGQGCSRAIRLTDAQARCSLCAPRSALSRRPGQVGSMDEGADADCGIFVREVSLVHEKFRSWTLL